MPQLGYLPQVGETIDRYTVLAELAHGGMAAVYVVSRSAGSFDKLFAMKVMLPHLVSESQFVDMFVDEARIAANVQHPNVVQVFDVGEHRGTPYMVMEYLRGQSLSAIQRRSRFSVANLLGVLGTVAEGLHAAHETKDVAGTPLSIVHRDVSPQNIHVGYDGSVKVVDFGIAAAAGRITQTRTGEVKGKLSYAAPEQLRSKRAVDRRLDLWALSVVAWEALTGERLFRGETDADTIYNVYHKRVPGLPSDVPREAAEVIAACLERNVELRPDTAAEVASAFQNAAAALGGTDRAAVGARVAEAFVRERAIEDERIAAAVGGSRSPAREEEASSGRAQVDLPEASEEDFLAAVTRTEIDPPRRSRWAPAAVLALVLAAFATTFALWDRGEAPSNEPIESAEEPERPESARPESTPGSTPESTPGSTPGSTPESTAPEAPEVEIAEPAEAPDAPDAVEAQRVTRERRTPMRARRRSSRMQTSEPPSMVSMRSNDLMEVPF